MRLPEATFIAQYPEAQALVIDVRKERIPCIRPHVVFINWRIFFASVEDEDKGVPGLAAMGFRIGDNGRDEGFVSRCLLGRVWDSVGGEAMIEGNPIDDESVRVSCDWADCNELPR